MWPLHDSPISCTDCNSFFEDPNWNNGNLAIKHKLFADLKFQTGSKSSSKGKEKGQAYRIIFYPRLTHDA